MQTLAIIIPCYNEENRLNGENIAELLLALDEATIYLVNDGSRDATGDLLKKIADSHPDRVRVLSYKENEGKARAIRKGILELKSSEHFRYLAYMDADFSTPIAEFTRLFTLLKREEAPFIFGSRIRKLNSKIERTPFRHLAGRIVATLIDLHFKLGIYDTQCGAKIFSRELAAGIFDQPFYCSWLFDVEIFIRLKMSNHLHAGIEMPVKEWKDIGGSKLGWKSFPKICREMIALMKNYK